MISKDADPRAIAQFFVEARRAASAMLNNADLVLTPAADMVMALYTTEDTDIGIERSNLYGATDVPGYVARRWLDVLAERQVVDFTVDGLVKLRADAVEALDAYFSEMSSLTRG
jgi:hypothetical protein